MRARHARRAGARRSRSLAGATPIAADGASRTTGHDRRVLGPPVAGFDAVADVDKVDRNTLNRCRVGDVPGGALG